MLLRDRQRLARPVASANVCPFGIRRLSGTIYRIDAMPWPGSEFFIRIRNSMDAVADRDFILDFLFFASTFSCTSAGCGRFYFVQFRRVFLCSDGRQHCFRQQPDAAEKESGCIGIDPRKNRQSLRSSGSLLTVLKGLPMTYNKICGR